MRVVAIAFSALLLSACSLVVSSEKVLTAEDTAATAPLKPGLWLLTETPDCRVPPDRPISRWPRCAGAVLVRPHDIVVWDKEQRRWQALPYELGEGEQKVLQLPWQQTPPVYVFYALTPNAPKGRAWKLSLLVCDGKTVGVQVKADAPSARAPRRRKSLSEETPEPMTPEATRQADLVAGLHPLPDGGGCEPNSKADLFKVARANLGHIDFYATWVRETP